MPLWRPRGHYQSPLSSRGSAPFLLLFLGLIPLFSCKSAPKKRAGQYRTPPPKESSFLFVGGGKLQLHPERCSQKGGLAPAVGVLIGHKGAQLLFGADTLGSPRLGLTQKQRRELARSLFLGLGYLGNPPLFVGQQGLTLGVSWLNDAYDNLILPGGEDGSLLSRDGALFFGLYVEGTGQLSTAHRMLQTAFRKSGARLFVGVVSGNLLFARTVAKLEGGPRLLLLSGGAGNRGFARQEQGVVLVSSAARFRAGVRVVVRFGEGETLHLLHAQEGLHREQLTRLDRALAMATGAKRGALQRRKALLLNASLTKRSGAGTTIEVVQVPFQDAPPHPGVHDLLGSLSRKGERLLKGGAPEDPTLCPVEKL